VKKIVKRKNLTVYFWFGFRYGARKEQVSVTFDLGLPVASSEIFKLTKLFKNPCASLNEAS